MTARQPYPKVLKPEAMRLKMTKDILVGPLLGAFFRTLWCHMAKETTPNDWEEAGTISIEIQVPEAVRPLLKFFANVVGEDYAEFESFVFSELVKVGFSEKAIKVETELEEGMLICDIKKYECYQ